jgi:hypothetical protein
MHRIRAVITAPVGHALINEGLTYPSGFYKFIFSTSTVTPRITIQDIGGRTGFELGGKDIGSG